MDFAGRHVVVTGGTGALGTAVVGALIDLGAICHVPEFGTSAPGHFPYGQHEQVKLATGIDLSDETAVSRFYGGFSTLWASIHIAGGFHMAPALEISKSDFMKQISLNAITSFLCCREAAKRMSAGGRIVNVVSRQALEPRIGAGTTAYTAAKAAVLAYTEALAEELAPSAIWVNAVAPSLMDTPANRASMPDADHAAWPKVAEVAETIVFLASPHNRVTRGAAVPVYGKV